jgi:Circularly permutated YpsA SLOG family
MITKLVSGGQSGVDRAALDVALQLNIPCGGWCPKGRKAEDRPIPDRYPLTETPSIAYSQRTRWNVRDSDATLILTWGKSTGGTALTIKACQQADKPHLVIDLADDAESAAKTEVARKWLAANLKDGVLNVAGPRASKNGAVYERAKYFLLELIKMLIGTEALDEQQCTSTNQR